MTRKFHVEVPCTVIDTYYVYAESEVDAISKMQGSMTERTQKRPDGDYEMIFVGADPHESETHWEKATIIEEVPNA